MRTVEKSADKIIASRKTIVEQVPTWADAANGTHEMVFMQRERSSNEIIRWQYAGRSVLPLICGWEIHSLFTSKAHAVSTDMRSVVPGRWCFARPWKILFQAHFSYTFLINKIFKLLTIMVPDTLYLFCKIKFTIFWVEDIYSVMFKIQKKEMNTS